MADPRSLDALDPPPWGSPPADATFPVQRCHELRIKPISDFGVQDSAAHDGQQIALPHLIPLALVHLNVDPLADDGVFPGDLLTVVLRVEPSFWQANSLLANQLQQALDRLPWQAELTNAADAKLVDDVASFRASVRR